MAWACRFMEGEDPTKSCNSSWPMKTAQGMGDLLVIPRLGWQLVAAPLLLQNEFLMSFGMISYLVM